MCIKTYYYCVVNLTTGKYKLENTMIEAKEIPVGSKYCSYCLGFGRQYRLGFSKASNWIECTQCNGKGVIGSDYTDKDERKELMEALENNSHRRNVLIDASEKNWELRKRLADALATNSCERNAIVKARDINSRERDQLVKALDNNFYSINPKFIN